MRQTILITGNQGTGKTSLAAILIGKRKYVVIDNDELRGVYMFRNVKDDTEFILIDEPSPDVFDVIKNIITTQAIIINKKYKKTHEMVLPNLIVISNRLPADLLVKRRNMLIVECK